MPNNKTKIGYWEVVAIGIGGMVGGGIFTVLGLAVQLAHGGTPIAFALAGVVALLTTYSYAKLSVAFPGFTILVSRPELCLRVSIQGLWVWP